MKYLTEDEIIYIHNRIIEEIGGIQGIRDVNLLSSAIHKIK